MVEMSRELASRSTHGCWTCRLRKKKCDENHPACFRCTSLHITCDGYGPRPYWMDRGHLQREQARYKSRIIAQAKSGIQENDLPIRGRNLDGEHDSAGTTIMAASSHAPGHDNPQFLGILGVDGDLDTSSDSMRSEILSSMDFSSEIFDDQIICIDPSHHSSSSVSPQTLAASIPHVTEDVNMSTSLDALRPNPVSEGLNLEVTDLLCDPMLSQGGNSSIFSGRSIDTDWSNCEQRVSPPGSGSGCPDFVPSVGRLGDPIMHGDTEDILFMYYLDHAFYVHCPFYFPSSRQGRGWLLSILKRVNSAYHAALALSEYHYLASTQHNNNTAHSRSGASHYEFALRDLETNLTRSSTWGGNTGLTHHVEVLTTILHLLFYQVRFHVF